MKLRHGRIETTLHALSSSAASQEGPPLLLLHALGGSADGWSSDVVEAWPGAVYALDLPGHGESQWVGGGGYYPEYFLFDADQALKAIGGRVAVAGAGIGAYVALLLAGARPDVIPAALLLPGIGLAGGGGEPDFGKRPFASLEEWDRRTREEAARYDERTDPMVASCEHDLRPPDYVIEFAAAARRLLFSVEVDAAREEIPWWTAARAHPGSADAPASIAEALRSLHGSLSTRD